MTTRNYKGFTKKEMKHLPKEFYLVREEQVKEFNYSKGLAENNTVYTVNNVEKTIIGFSGCLILLFIFAGLFIISSIAARENPDPSLVLILIVISSIFVITLISCLVVCKNTLAISRIKRFDNKKSATNYAKYLQETKKDLPITER